MKCLKIFTGCLSIALLLAACSTSTHTQTPPTTPTPMLIPPPVQGPAVLGDNVVIENWAYLGSDFINPLPIPDLSGANVRQVGKGAQESWLVKKEDGFDLVWVQLPCATQPVLVIHSDATLEFWPGESVNPDCEEMGVSHVLTVQWQTTLPFDEWKFIFHPPPPPES